MIYNNIIMIKKTILIYPHIVEKYKIFKNNKSNDQVNIMVINIFGISKKQWLYNIIYYIVYTI